MMQMATELVRSGMLPAHIKSPAAAVAVIQKGRELGIAPMYALSHIIVIQGKPTATAELMAALIYRDHGDDALDYEESTVERCTIAYKRRNASKRSKHTFTQADAKAAGLSGGNWAKYPAAMLRARCISAVARMGFPDSIGGMYTPEEVGHPEYAECEVITVGDFQVDATTGEIVEAPPADVLSMEESLGRKLLGRARLAASKMTSTEPACEKVTQHAAGLLFEALGDEADCDHLVRAIFGNGLKGLRADQADFISNWSKHDQFKRQVLATLAVVKAEQTEAAPVAF